MCFRLARSEISRILRVGRGNQTTPGEGTGHPRLSKPRVERVEIVVEIPEKTALFVCNGSSHRSAMAETIMKSLNWDWVTESANLDNITGEFLDCRSIGVIQEKGYELKCGFRKVTQEDFFNYNYIIGLDTIGVRKLMQMAPPGTVGKVHVLTEFDPKGGDCVQDPQLDGRFAGYRRCIQTIERSIRNFNVQHEA